MEPNSELLRSFIVNNFLFGDDSGLEDSTSFLESGMIDSTGILELIGFLEHTFVIKVKDSDLVPENLDSIVNVMGYGNHNLSEAR